MGQYHAIVNLDKRESVDPSVFGDGLKLMEIAYSNYSTKAALAFLIADKWKGDLVTVAGDYTEKSDLTDEMKRMMERICEGYDIYNMSNLFTDEGTDGYGFDGYEEINNQLKESFNVTLGKGSWGYNEVLFEHGSYENEATIPFTKVDWFEDYENCIVYNYDKNEYLSFGEKSLHSVAGGETGIMPAYLYMLSTSNGRSGGDLEEIKGFESGSWVGDRTGIISKQLEPELFEKITKKDALEETVDGFKEYFSDFVNDHYLERLEATRDSEKILDSVSQPKVETSTLKI